MASRSTDEAALDEFIGRLSETPAEEWQKRIAALKRLVQSIPNSDEVTAVDFASPPSQPIPWYRSSKSVRRLAPPLKTLLLDARSAVVNDSTDLIGTLFTVKLRPNPSITGRLLLKDLLPTILQLSAQTVKTIRSYGTSMTLDIIPKCRVKSCIVILGERLRSDKNRTVREDCAIYLRCVLETWPCDPNEDIETLRNEGDSSIANNIEVQSNERKEECISREVAKQIGIALARALSDPAQPVRAEAKKGFQVLFQRYRPVWAEVMNAGVIRDVRLRKNLLDAASRSDGVNGNIFEDLVSMCGDDSVGGGSLRSGVSHYSHRSYASRGMGVGGQGRSNINSVPAVIGTPVRPRRFGSSPASSPKYMSGTTSSSSKAVEEGKVTHESTSKYSSNAYVTTSGRVFSTPSPRRSKHQRPMNAFECDDVTPAKQPFASLLKTPQIIGMSPMNNHSPLPNSNHKPTSRRVLRDRLSRRISGVPKDGLLVDGNVTTSTTLAPVEYQLSSINESDVGDPTTDDAHHPTEITNVALEVIAAHLAHLTELDEAVSKERALIVELGKLASVDIIASQDLKSIEVSSRLSTLSEDQVCDYFESVHVCVDKQRTSSERLLKEMERISQGGEADVSREGTDLDDVFARDGVPPQERNVAQCVEE
eukprot:scaffold7917_cov183-Alexandrium_tamarense.AAC.10